MEKATWPKIPPARLFAVLAVVLGAIDAGFLLGWRQINPVNVSWLKGDPAVYQAGWEFLRRQAWSFPPTWLSTLDYPFGISASYLDVIPLAAIPLHLVSKLLPDNFQYLGIYASLCLMLQVFFALQLMARFTSDKFVVFVGALFFLAAPILVMRMFGHFSLCSQWLILAALSCYFGDFTNGRIGPYLRPFAVLLVLAAGLTPYLCAMVMGVAWAAIFRTCLQTDDRTPAQSPTQPASKKTNCMSGTKTRRIISRYKIQAIWSGIFVACTLLALMFFGFITPDSATQIEGSGYGDYSMNVLAPLNAAGVSPFLPSIPVLPAQQFEGFNYLGAGVLVLCLLCLTRPRRFAAEIWSRRLRPLLCLSIILLFLATSTHIAVGRFVFTIPAPHRLNDLLAIFRSSGRFFWPVHYLVVLGALAGTLAIIRKRWAMRAVIGAAFLLQVADTAALSESVANQSRQTVSTPLTAPDWLALTKRHRHLVILPARQCDSDHTPGGDADWPWFAQFAARNDLTLNSVHAARNSSESNNFNCDYLPGAVSRGILKQDTAYVLTDQLAVLVVQRNNTHFCRRVAGFDLCTFDPARAALSQSWGYAILSPYSVDTEFRSDRSRPAQILLEGFDERPAPAIWTVGKKAAVYIRPSLSPPRDAILEMTFGGRGALLSPIHRVQRAIVTLDGNKLGVLYLALGGENRTRSLVIPGKLLRTGQVNQIAFELPDAASPSDLDMGIDRRLLGLYVSRIRIVSRR